jgi:hypothetical protein
VFSVAPWRSMTACTLITKGRVTEGIASTETSNAALVGSTTRYRPSSSIAVGRAPNGLRQAWDYKILTACRPRRWWRLTAEQRSPEGCETTIPQSDLLFRSPGSVVVMAVRLRA